MSEAIGSAATETPSVPFVDRRQAREGAPNLERRQFLTSQPSFRPEVMELSEAVDHYKLTHRRRFITFEELFDVMTELGYHK